jgi:hypothetical protein
MSHWNEVESATKRLTHAQNTRELLEYRQRFYEPLVTKRTLDNIRSHAMPLPEPSEECQNG